MNKLTTHALFGALILAIAGFALCSRQVAGVETTNGCTVTANATTIEGFAPPQSRVFLFNADYIPFVDSGIGIGTAANDYGEFRFPASQTRYNIFVMDPEGNTAGISVSIPHASGSTISRQQQMKRPGEIAGNLTLLTTDTMLVYLEGMCHYRVVAGSGEFTMKNVPEGSYMLKVIQLSARSKSIPLHLMHAEPVSVTGGKISSIGNLEF